jgi:hypothetical protein
LIKGDKAPLSGAEPNKFGHVWQRAQASPHEARDRVRTYFCGEPFDRSSAFSAKRSYSFNSEYSLFGLLVSQALR